MWDSLVHAAPSRRQICLLSSRFSSFPADSGTCRDLSSFGHKRVTVGDKSWLRVHVPVHPDDGSLRTEDVKTSSFFTGLALCMGATSCLNKRGSFWEGRHITASRSLISEVLGARTAKAAV